MNARSSWIRGALLVALLVGLLSVLEAHAKGSRGGRGGGRGARAPRVHAAQRAYNAPRMSRATAPARTSAASSRALSSGAQAHAGSAQTRANVATAAARQGSAGTVNSATTGAVHSTATGTVNRGGTGTVNTTGTTPMSLSPNTYTYGSGTGARPYHAYGYGRGYRNRYYGGRNGYGRSQGSNRAIVARLRSVHRSLARIDHDYRGHRVRAMHSISMAIRQLSHRSMIYSGVGFAPRMNNGMGMGQGGAGGIGAGGIGAGGIGARGAGAGGIGGGARRRQPMSQAQSDARMSQDLRTLQGINMQLNSQGYRTTSHARASGHVQHAVRELGMALAIR
jgi:hypothetical protein